MELLENKNITTNLIQGHDKTKQIYGIKNFTEDEIKEITSNYATPIGKGGFGIVYKSSLGDDHDSVAVKRYIRGDLREEFMEEVSIHSQIDHKNVVKFIGYCIGEDALMMVTEYIPRGNLDNTLHNSEISIPLEIRLGIAIGCAEALHYMHSMHNLVCHGDIKPANILLDGNFIAKISDFGLSRLLSGGVTRYTTNVKGSIDYMDPIYLQKGRLTPRSDVYSFGIVLLELITRRRVKEGNFSLIDKFGKAYIKGKGWRQLLDAEIANESNMMVLEEIGKLATECLTLDIDNRPRMSDVGERLRLLKKSSLQKDYRKSASMSSSNSMVNWMKNFGTSKRKPDYSYVQTKLNNVRVFTKEDLNEVTHNYSYLLGKSYSTEVYKGRLQDNTMVVVKKCLVDGEHKDEFINEAIILSQIDHKNIIKLLGCCLEDDNLIFLYEYATKGKLSDILDDQEDFPLDSRVKIAVKTAEALEYLHSLSAGIIGHCDVVPSNILLDDGFMPKLAGFSVARRHIKESHRSATHSATCSCAQFGGQPLHLQSVLQRIVEDVRNFGVVLLALIGRRHLSYLDVQPLLEARKNQNIEWWSRTGSLLDKEIAAEEDIITRDEIGRLAVKCIRWEKDDVPTMEKVAQRLQMIRRSRERRMEEGLIQSKISHKNIIVEILFGTAADPAGRTPCPRQLKQVTETSAAAVDVS